MLITNPTQGSATIYQFPAGGRAPLGGRRYGETGSTNDFAAQTANLADCSGSWYHAAAIQETKPGLDH